MNENLSLFVVFAAIAIPSFVGGCFFGRVEIAELKNNGYKIVKHEIKHGDYYTNWVEVVRENSEKMASGIDKLREE